MLDPQAPSKWGKPFPNSALSRIVRANFQTFSFYFQTDWPSWSVLANGKHSSIQGKISALITIKEIGKKRVLGDISDGEPRRPSWEFEIGDKELCQVLEILWRTIF